MSATATSVRLRADSEVVWATIDRPHVRNAIDPWVVAGLEAAVELAASRAAKALVLRGAGGTFCSGADLAHVRALVNREDELREFIASIGDVLRALEELPCPAVAVVEGHAVAGGLELLLACDIVVAASDAQFGEHHAAYGLVPAAGSSVRLVRALPREVANHLLLTGSTLTAREAAAHGLVTLAVEQARLDTEVGAVVDRLRVRSGEGLATVKRMIATGRRSSYREALGEERALFAAHASASRDMREGVAAFREKRAPRFAAVDPQAEPNRLNNDAGKMS